MPDLSTELSRPGTLRAGINLSNPLLVTGKAANGDPEGVSPSMAAALAKRLGLAVELVPFPSPGAAADALAEDAWDIILIAEEPQRAETIAFSGVYVEIEATYLVPDGSAIASVDDVDRPGKRIAISARSAYDLYLSRTIRHAELVRAEGLKAAADLFRDGDAAGSFDALAGLRPALIENQKEIAGSRVLDGRFTAVRQSIGTKPGNTALRAEISAFVAESRAGGLVQTLIDGFGVTGKLTVAADD